MATFWGIGVGPGDSELLTVKAVKTIEQLDVLYAPQAKKGGASLAESIAAPYLPEQLTIKRRHFPMTKNWEEKMASWQTIASEIVADVQAGQEVGFLTLGDPSVYSTFSYIATLVTDQIAVATIAGISSYSQIAASLNQPLMLDEESLTIMPATADTAVLRRAITDNDNVVLMKISTNFAVVYDLLAEQQLLDQATVIMNASMTTQEAKRMSDFTVTDQLPYFSTLLLKKRDTIGG